MAPDQLVKGWTPRIQYEPDEAVLLRVKVRGRDGEPEERSETHRLVAFGKLAEICGQYLSKGRQVYIEGRLTTRSWEDRQGNQRKTTEIVAQNMQMLGGRPGGGGEDQPGTAAETPEFQAETVKIEDDDLPF